MMPTTGASVPTYHHHPIASAGHARRFATATTPRVTSTAADAAIEAGVIVVMGCG
jgi:hypothetical protein